MTQKQSSRASETISESTISDSQPLQAVLTHCCVCVCSAPRQNRRCIQRELITIDQTKKTCRFAFVAVPPALSPRRLCSVQWSPGGCLAHGRAKQPPGDRSEPGSDAEETAHSLTHSACVRHAGEGRWGASAQAAVTNQQASKSMTRRKLS